MKRFLLLCVVVCAFAITAKAQGNQYQPNMLTYQGVPTGTCERNEMALDITNNNLYICSGERNGTWVLVGGAGGSQQNGNVCGSLPTAPNQVSQFCTSTPSGGVGGTPTFIKPGLTPRGVYGTTATDTLSATDFPGIVMYRTSVAVAVALPTPATLQLPGAITSLCNQTSPAQTITVTAASPYTFDVTGTATFTLSQNQCARITVGDQNNTWNASTFGSAAVAPGGAGNSIQYNNGGALGGISGSVTGQVLTAKNASVAAFASPGTPDGNGATHVTTTPYTILCDSASTVRDRGTTIILDVGSSNVQLPAHTTLGCTNNMAFTLINTGNLVDVVFANGSDTFNLYGDTPPNGSNIAQTSFSIPIGATAYVNNGESTTWNVVLVSPTGSTTGMIYANALIPGTIAYDASMTATPINSGNSTTATANASNATNVINDSVLQIFGSFTANFSAAPTCGTVLVNTAYSSTGPKYGLQADYTPVASSGGTAASCTGTYTGTSAWDTITLAIAPTSGNTITWRTPTTAQQTNGATITLNNPTGTAGGDYMVACIAWVQGATPNNISPPNNYWTPVAVTDQNPVSTHYRISCWSKVATAAEPASYAWTQVVSADGLTGFIATAQNGMAIDDLITSTSATWTSANVGQDICVRSGGALPKVSGIDLAPQACGTIAQVISGTTALCTTCSAAITVSNVELRYGADNSQTLQNYLTQVPAGQKLMLPSGLFMVSLAPLVSNNYQLVLPLSASQQGYTIEGVDSVMTDYSSPSGIQPHSTAVGSMIDIATTALVQPAVAMLRNPTPNIGWGITTLKDFTIWGGAGIDRDGGGDGARMGGQQGGTGLWFSSADRLYLERMQVENFAGNGLELIIIPGGNFYGGNQITIDFSTFAQNGNDGMLITGGGGAHLLQNVEMRNNSFENNGIAPGFAGDAGLELSGEVWGLTMTTNDFTRNYGVGQIVVDGGFALQGCFMGGNYFESDSPTSPGDGNASAFAVSPIGSLISCGMNSSLFNGAGSFVPVISSGFGTSPSITNYNIGNYSTAFTLNVGTGGTATSGVIRLGLNVGNTGWDIHCSDMTTQSSTVFQTIETATTAAGGTVGNFNSSGVAAAWASGDVLSCVGTAY